jgi:hypothetical protein
VERLCEHRAMARAAREGCGSGVRHGVQRGHAVRVHARRGTAVCSACACSWAGRGARVACGPSGGVAALQRRGGQGRPGHARVKKGGGRRLARRGAAKGRACGSQAGGRRGKEERKGRKKKREKKERGKRKEMGEREKERARKRKGNGIASALIEERRSRVVDRPPSGAGWDGDEGKERTVIAKGGLGRQLVSGVRTAANPGED